MLFELKFYYQDGHVAHDLIECENPTKWEGNTVLTNIAKRTKFETTSLLNQKIIKISNATAIPAITATTFVLTCFEGTIS